MAQAIRAILLASAIAATFVGRRDIGYFGCTLEAMDAITLVAILNASSRSLMPWRWAIQLKSV